MKVGKFFAGLIKPRPIYSMWNKKSNKKGRKQREGMRIDKSRKQVEEREEREVERERTTNKEESSIVNICNRGNTVILNL